MGKTLVSLVKSSHGDCLFFCTIKFDICCNKIFLNYMCILGLFFPIDDFVFC